jgi:hypothetical protein
MAVYNAAQALERRTAFWRIEQFQQAQLERQL